MLGAESRSIIPLPVRRLSKTSEISARDLGAVLDFNRTPIRRRFPLSSICDATLDALLSQLRALGLIGFSPYTSRWELGNRSPKERVVELLCVGNAPGPG